MNLYGSMCLSDIPKELIRTAGNGKKYLNIEVNERREPSQYGQTHYVKASCRKDQAKEGVNYYIGELKPSAYQPYQQQQQQQQQRQPGKFVASKAPQGAGLQPGFGQDGDGAEDLPF